MDWLNEPPEWQANGSDLDLVTGDRTDFWRRTHYGFVRDDGHARLTPAPGDFSATVAFRGDYATLYDQAGLMLRLDAATWIKAGVEYVADRRMLSVVVTRDVSDWSTTPVPVDDPWLTLRLTRIGTAAHVHWAPGEGGRAFRMLRLAWFPEGAAAVGPMACSPQRAGFRAAFFLPGSAGLQGRRGFVCGAVGVESAYAARLGRASVSGRAARTAAGIHPRFRGRRGIAPAPHCPVHACRRKSLARSAIITVGALVLPPGRQGMTEASTTRSPSMPRTRSSGSTTALASVPMRQVPIGW